jgi:hypothetical protein
MKRITRIAKRIMTVTETPKAAGEMPSFFGSAGSLVRRSIWFYGSEKVYTQAVNKIVRLGATICPAQRSRF